MWSLKNIASGEFFYLLNEKEKYAVGRIGSDLVLKDTSVSRTHAFLHLVSLPRGGSIAVEVEDVGSKFGTYRNDGVGTKTPLAKGKRVRLQTGDRIRFGLLTSLFLVTHEVIISLATGLSDNESQRFNKYLHALGGTVLNEWRNDGCATHLTISEENRFTPTKKVLHALLNDVALVTCEYWMELLHSCKIAVTPLPQPQHYMPQSLLQNEEYKLDAGHRAARQHLFDDRFFVFLNRKTLDVYRSIVEKAGGSCRQLTKAITNEFLCQDNVITIEYIPSTQTESSQTVCNRLDYLKTHSRRLIPEYEIGLAILTCSTVKYCNPSYNIMDDLLPPTEPQMVTDAKESAVPPTEAAKDLPMFPSMIPDSGDDEVAIGGTGTAKRKKCQRLLQSSDDESAANSDNEYAHKHKKKSTTTKPAIAPRLSYVEDSDLELNESSVSPVPKGKRKSVIADSDDEESDNEPLAKKPYLPKEPSANGVADADKHKNGTATEPTTSARPSSVVDSDFGLSESSAGPVRVVPPKGKRKTVIADSDKDSDNEPIANCIAESQNPFAEYEQEEDAAAAGHNAKLRTSNVFIDDSDADNDMFLSAKELQDKRIVKTSQANALPALLEAGAACKVNGKATKNTRGFLEKSQRHSSTQLNRSGQAIAESASAIASKSIKRLRIPILGEDDDVSDDDLFSFGKASPKRANKQFSDDQFDFDVRRSPIVAVAEPPDDGCAVPAPPKAKQQQLVLPKPKPQPRTLDVSGWLSCGMQAVKIEKGECDADIAPNNTTKIKQESNDPEYDVDWVHNLKCCISVKPINSSVRSKGSFEDSHSSTLDTSNVVAVLRQNNSNGKNFKRFVKRAAPLSLAALDEKKLVKTVSVTVGNL